MPASTPKGIPYPVGTDRVSDGDNAIQALAEWVDTYLDGTAWAVASLASGWTTGGAGNEPAYRKDSAGNVHIQGVLGYPSPPGVPAFVLPEGFRPPSGFISGAVVDLANVAHPTCSWSINAAGEVSLVDAAGTVTGINCVLNIVFATRAR